MAAPRRVAETADDDDDDDSDIVGKKSGIFFPVTARRVVVFPCQQHRRPSVRLRTAINRLTAAWYRPKYMGPQSNISRLLLDAHAKIN